MKYEVARVWPRAEQATALDTQCACEVARRQPFLDWAHMASLSPLRSPPIVIACSGSLSGRSSNPLISPPPRKSSGTPRCAPAWLRFCTARDCKRAPSQTWLVKTKKSPHWAIFALAVAGASLCTDAGNGYVLHVWRLAPPNETVRRREARGTE